MPDPQHPSPQRASARAEPPRARTPKRRALIDQRDRDLLEFLAEQRIAIETHVQQLLGVGPAAAARRVRRLHGSGLLARLRIFDGMPWTLRITAAGLGAIGSELQAPGLNYEGYRHDVGVGWLWLAARAGWFGALDQMWSDRSMQAHDARRARAARGREAASTGGQALGLDTDGRALGLGLGLPGMRGGERLHYPDLLLALRSGHLIAIELELTTKSRARLDQIMLAYAGDGRIDAVLYLVPDRRSGLPVLEAARRAGIADRVQVQLLAPGSPEGAPAREAQRALTHRHGRTAVAR